jgi:hypothetical protein
VNTLKRYGVIWVSDITPITGPMKDGYWTPWHLAQERIAELEKEVQELTNQLIAMHKGELHD